MKSTQRLLVREVLQPHFIKLAHDTHQGIVRAKQRLRDLHWWPGMDVHIEFAIKAFITCQQHDKTAVTHPSPLQPVPYPDAAWEKLAIDIVGPFDSVPQCHWIGVSLSLSLMSFVQQMARNCLHLPGHFHCSDQVPVNCL